MDVPIARRSAADAGAQPLRDRARRPAAFFDAAVTLLFFLLVGRYLDQLMRQRARSAVDGLRRLVPRGAMVRQRGGTLEYLPLEAIEPGMMCTSAPANGCRSTCGSSGRHRPRPLAGDRGGAAGGGRRRATRSRPAR